MDSAPTLTTASESRRLKEKPITTSFPKSSRSTFSKLLLLSSVFLFQFVIFLPLSQKRLIALDEGFYALAAKLSVQGQVVYSDFFYPQMPLLPYVYGIWMLISGFEWQSARLLSALITALLGTLVFVEAERRQGIFLGLVGAFLFASSSMVFPWYLLVKTYALSMLFLFAAYMLFERSQGEKRSMLFTAGVCLGLAVNVRLFFALMLPLFVISLLLRWRRFFWPSLAALSGGFLLTMLPHLYWLLGSYDTYLFNNLGYHLMRSEKSEEAEWKVRKIIFSIVMGLRPTQQYTGLQLPILIWLNLFYGAWSVVFRRKLDLAIAVALVLFFVNLLPSPCYLQYFCTLLPFLILGALAVLRSILDARPFCFGPARLFAHVCLLAVLLPYSIHWISKDIVKYTQSGQGVIGVDTPDKARDFNLQAVKQVSEAINSLSQFDDHVLASWPGYLLEAQASPLPGFENHFGVEVAARLSSRQRKNLKVSAWLPAIRNLDELSPKLVVFRQLPRGPRLVPILVNSGYEPRFKIGDTEVFLKQEAQIVK